MKQILLILSLSISFIANSQTLMRIHKSNGTTQDYPINEVDSVTYVIPDDQPNTIANIVSTNPDFSILKKAVVRAGLVDALSGNNPVTVFAPNNAAFASLGLTEADINTLNLDTLTAILLYHVVSGKVGSSDVPVSDTVNSLLGTNIYASSNKNGVFVNGIKVISPDVEASNGIIHVISSVLIPPTKTLAEIVSEDPELSLLFAAVLKAGLAEVASSPNKLTVFAPTDSAFTAAGLNQIAIGLADSSVVFSVAADHILGTNVFASDLISGGDPLQTIATTTALQVGLTPPSVKIVGSINEPSEIIEANIIATNGVIHKINKVLLIAAP